MLSVFSRTTSEQIAGALLPGPFQVVIRPAPLPFQVIRRLTPLSFQVVRRLTPLPFQVIRGLTPLPFQVVRRLTPLPFHVVRRLTPLRFQVVRRRMGKDLNNTITISFCCGCNTGKFTLNLDHVCECKPMTQPWVHASWVHRGQSSQV